MDRTARRQLGITVWAPKKVETVHDPGSTILGKMLCLCSRCDIRIHRVLHVSFTRIYRAGILLVCYRGRTRAHCEDRCTQGTSRSTCLLYVRRQRSVSIWLMLKSSCDNYLDNLQKAKLIRSSCPKNVKRTGYFRIGYNKSNQLKECKVSVHFQECVVLHEKLGAGKTGVPYFALICRTQSD